MSIELSNLLLDIVWAILIPAIPIVAKSLMTFFKAKSDKLIAEIKNENIAKLLNAALDSVATAVTYTSQVYVDNLKRDNVFDADSQKKAMDMAMNKAKSMLTQDTRDILAMTYGDVDEWLAAHIEAAVYNQKSAQ